MRKRQEIEQPDSCLNKAKDEELIFVLLSRDETAVATVEFWIRERIRVGKNAMNDAQIQEAVAWCTAARNERRMMS